MRSCIYLLFFTISLHAFSEDFKVFEKDGYYGVKDEEGQVTVPPVYEKLGWSSGEDEVFEGLIGYRRGDAWGLISARNKVLTDQKFYSLEPFKTGFIKGSIKGRFSNHLFYGLLNAKGQTVVSFNYFELTQFGDDLLVSEFNAREQIYGLVSMENEILIPLKYQFISKENQFLLGKTFNHSFDIFLESRLLQSSVDSIKFSEGLIAYRAGYAAFINNQGRLIHDFKFKSIEFENGKALGRPFPSWKVYWAKELQFEWECDSINRTENKIWVAHLNGAQHIVLPESAGFKSKEYVIKKIKKDFAIVQHSKQRKFSVVNTEGEILFGGYDSISFSETHFFALKKGKWDIINSSGKKLHKMSFDQILAGPRHFFISSRDNHWGVIDFNGDQYLSFKYDSIIYTPEHYQVKYFGKWGILDFHENWLVQPDFEEVQSFGNVVIARKGLGYSVFYGHQFKFQTTNTPLYALGENVVIQSDSSKIGLINNFGEMMAEPVYDQVLAWDDKIELRRGGYSKLISNEGAKIFDETDKIQEVGGVSESYFSVKKNDKWGFVDSAGNLRVSNRYDSVRLFNQGMCAVKLRDKWGFINREESIVVQPYYDQVSPFNDGLAIVSVGGLSGIIDTKGKIIVEISFKEIDKLSTGNFLVRNGSDKLGLLNADGFFLLRPAYDYLEDTKEGVVIMQDDKWGLLDYNGNQLYNLAYGFVQVIENFIVIKI